MNSSAFHTSIHTVTDIDLYSSTGSCYDATQPYPLYADYSRSLYEDPSSSAEDSSGQYAGLGPYSDADQALFEEFLTTEVASINPPGFCAVVPVQSPPSYSSESAPNPLHYLEPLSGSQVYSYATSSLRSNLSPNFEKAVPELIASRISPTIYPSVQSVYDLQEECSITAMFVPGHANQRMGCPIRSSCPYPSPSPEPSLQASSSVIASDLQGIPPHASLAFEHSLPELTVSCISPDLICPSNHCAYDLEDDHPTNGSFRSSGPSRRATRHGSPYTPYPTPSPEPSPRTSSTVFACQRRNTPARTAAPVSFNTWQCPHCPYVQRNRRSPDLKRHIKTHTRDADVADWVCCGVPVLNAIELGVPAATVREARAFNFDGTLMLAGCRKAFSRRDALIRHLQREKGKCFGDAQSLYQRGNRESC